MLTGLIVKGLLSEMINLVLLLSINDCLSLLLLLLLLKELSIELKSSGSTKAEF